MEQKIQDAVIVSGETEKTTIENRVKTEISKFNLADAGVNELIKKSEGLEVKSLEDVEEFEKIKTVLREFVSTRTGIDKKRKEINKPFDDIIKGVNEEGKRLTALLAPHEARLASERAKFEQWQKDEDERLEREEEEKLNLRIEELKNAGLVYNPEAMLYEVGDVISLDIVTIKKQSDFDYTALLEKVKIERKKIDERLEAERLAREEEEKRQREIAEKNERDRLEIRAEKLETRSGKLTDLGFRDDEENERFIFSRGELLIQMSYDETADLSLADFKTRLAGLNQTISENDAEIERVNAERLQKEISKKRHDAVIGLGFGYSGSFYTYKTLVYPSDEILKTENFEEIYSKLKTEVETVKSEELKKAEDARLEALPDFDKIERYLSEINAISVPQMKTDAGAETLSRLSEEIKSLVKKFSNEIYKLKK